MALSKMHLSKIIPKLTSRNVNSYEDLHFMSQKRIKSHILKHDNTSHVKEYKLMERFEEEKITPYIFAVEYEIDDNLKMNHSGDLLCFDGYKTLMVVELKCIKYHKEKTSRFIKVKDQAYKLSTRLSSWMTFLGNTNPSLYNLKTLRIIGGYFTDENADLKFL